LHVGEENEFFDRPVAIAGDFNETGPRKPFAVWHYVNKDLRDLVGKMTSLDPKRRIAAREALEHAWFREVD